MKKIFYLILLAFLSFTTIAQTSASKTQIPPQSGHAGQYLTTNGSKTSWGTVTAGLTGTLTSGYLPVATGSMSLGNSVIYKSGNDIGVNTTTPTAKFHAVGSGSTSVTYCAKFENSIARNLLQIKDDGSLTGSGQNLSDNSFLIGHSSGYISSQDFFDIGALDYGSNFNLRLRGNSDTRIDFFHNSGNKTTLSYLGGTDLYQFSSGVSYTAIYHPNHLRIGIDLGLTNIEPSSALQINSTTQGVLVPRMTTTQKNAISSPAEGLEVYDLTLHQKSYYNGTTWVNY